MITLVSRHRAGERGTNLVELLAVMVITGLIVAVLASVVKVSAKSNAQAKVSTESSTSTFDLTAFFAEDASSAGPVSGADPIELGQTGCGSGTSAVRFVGPGSTAGTVTIRSYIAVTAGTKTTLERRMCTGATLAAAAAATPTVRVVVTDLKAGTTTATCDVLPTANCQTATLTATTSSGRDLVVMGRIQAVLAPTPTTAVSPVTAPATGTCTLLADRTAWGATGGVAGDSGTNHGNDGETQTYDDTNQRRTFLHFDLTSPCQDSPLSWATLPGGRLLTSVTLKLAYLGKTNDKCWIFPGISYDSQVLQALDNSSTWTEAGLTGSNMPGTMRGSTYTFNVSGSGSLTTHTNTTISDAVNGWYQGTWVNNGFRLSRSSVGDTCGDANRFASRHNSNTALVPRLVITWG